MRVANLMLARGQGGLEAMACRYHDALAQTGFQLLSIGRRDSWFATQFPDGGFEGLGRSFAGDLGVAAELGRVLRRFAPDLVVAHGTRALRLARSPLVRARGRLAFVAHNFRFKPEMAEADLLIAASEPVAAGLRQRFPGRPVVVVENFGRLAFGAVRTTPRQPVRLGALGRLHVNKAFDVLVDAAAVLTTRGLDFTLRIAGEGPERARLDQKIARLGLQERVRLSGWAENPAAFFEDVDLFVLSSRVEPFGLVLIEAMAAGVPVVSTDVDGPGQILQGRDLALLAPPDDAERLATAVLQATADWPQAAARAERAQAETRARFGFEAGAARLAQVLRARA